MEDKNEKVLFEICCKVTFKRKVAFQLWGYKRHLLIPHIILIVYAFFMCSLKPDAVNYILTALAVLWVPAVYFFYALNEIMSCEDIPDKYIFYSDRIENSDYNGNHTFYLDKIKGAYETEDYFYVHMNKNEYGIIDKDKFVIGNPEKFAEYLRENFGEKFKVCKK